MSPRIAPCWHRLLACGYHRSDRNISIRPILRKKQPYHAKRFSNSELDPKVHDVPDGMICRLRGSRRWQTAMWTEEHRRIYRREGAGYPSDLRDAEWARLEPLIPAALPGGRPRKTDMRAAMNAILYLLRTGCPWRYLPRDSFPPRSTVYNIFRKSSVMASGRQSGPSCIWPCANGWVERPARRRRFSTANR